jgi:4-hydroxyphenylpyruvate dioxygenase-like putative hemolysin
MVKYTYENVIKSFEDKKCKLLTTAEEYYDMCKQKIKYKSESTIGINIVFLVVPICLSS